MRTSPLSKIRSIVFDFDGTLAELCLDFSQMKLRLNELAKVHSSHDPPTPFLPVLEWLAWLEKQMEDPIGARSFREAALALVSEIEIESAGKGSLFGFTRPLLASLRRQGVKTAIITRNCESAVHVVFPDIDDYCGAFLSRDHVPDPKPHPGHLVRAMRAIGADPDTTLMVGDHPIDIQTGKAVGIRTAGVFSGSASIIDLEQSGADWVAENCEKLFRDSGLMD